MKIKYLIPLIFLTFSSCYHNKNIIEVDEVIVNAEKNKNTIEKEELNRLGDEKSDLIKTYKGSNTKYIDLIHTKLNLKFNLKNKTVLGTAEIISKPYFYSTDSMVLDAVNFEIYQIELINGNSKMPLEYKYDKSKIYIKLNRIYTKDDTIKIGIVYKANPDKIKNTGSGWAIRSNKGLYFIDTDTDNPQIWTQGETQSNSTWFPTIDSPNQNMTQEIYLTVDQRFKTLSNGILISSLVNQNGTRTDYWKQDKPHAPYLAMIAVGKYEILKDYWRDLPVFVYVEKKHTDKAEKLFKKTYKMIDFYSEKLNYEFPWDKYSQIVVKNFVSGAMENTGAVVFGEFVLNFKNEEQRIENESIVAHELSHHWFGDLVTCESWANLPLNESFATYFEYLWLEHEYGRYTADIHLAKDYSYYTFERYMKDVNLIRFYNKHRDNMFDAHSYQKGSLILHMLRYTIGDEAFWRSLELYLKTNEYKPVEIHQLRLAFEEVTGQDLNWFFNQWFLNKGIPELNIKYDFSEEDKKAVISIEQIQDLKKFPLYKIPTKIDIYLSDTILTKSICIDEHKEKFEFRLNKKPLFINFDPDNAVLCKKNENYKPEEYIEILDKAPLFKDKKEALDKISNISNQKLNEIYFKLAKHEYSKFRLTALQRLNPEKDHKLYNNYLQLLKEISINDNDKKIRDLATKKYNESINDNN